MSRLNDTNALISRPLAEGECETREVRKIDNGYITRTSSYGPSGSYRSSESFSPDVPGASGGARSGVGNEGLADVKSYLGSDV